MLADLALGFCDKAQTPAITQKAARGTDKHGADIPESAQATRSGIKFGKPLFTPGKMVELLGGGFLELFSDVGRSGNERVSLVETLRRYLSGMIDTHQARGVTPFMILEFGIFDVSRRVRP